jgi:hypothetical protein
MLATATLLRAGLTRGADRPELRVHGGLDALDEPSRFAFELINVERPTKIVSSCAVPDARRWDGVLSA